jgi:hypothetical protein
LLATTSGGLLTTMQNNYRDLALLDDGASSSSRAFPITLHNMLDELETEGLAHIASWQPHGRCFLVHKRKEFAAIILPQ